MRKSAFVALFAASSIFAISPAIAGSLEEEVVDDGSVTEEVVVEEEVVLDEEVVDDVVVEEEVFDEDLADNGEIVTFGGEEITDDQILYFTGVGEDTADSAAEDIAERTASRVLDRMENSATGSTVLN